MPRRPSLTVELVPHPVADYDEQLDAALDVLADALAVRLIEKARAQVAAELGVDPETLDRGPCAAHQLAEVAQPRDKAAKRRRRSRGGVVT